MNSQYKNEFDTVMEFEHKKRLPRVMRKTRNHPKINSACLEVLHLAFDQSLTDKAIGAQMQVSERTVRNYWSKLQDILGIFPEPGKNIRTQTGKRAREEGLLDR